MRRDSSITEIKGIGEKTKKLFEKMGVYTVGDILLHFPRNYIQYPHPVPIDEYHRNKIWNIYGCLKRPFPSLISELVNDHSENYRNWKSHYDTCKCNDKGIL